MSEEHSDGLVVVATVPNIPIAEMLVEELRGNGIEAFYKSAAGVGTYGASAVMGPAGLCDICVRQADAERARELLPDA
jgi:hypothetical protein